MKIKKSKKLLLTAGLLLVFALTGKETILKEMTGQDLKTIIQKYPDSDTILLYNKEKIRYDEKGLSDSTDEYYQKVLTEKGQKKLRSFTFHFNSTYETLTIEKVQIIRPDKTTEINPASNSKISIEPDQMGSNIYDPANKILTLAIPGLQVGDIVGLRVRSQVKKARIPGFWGNYIPLQSSAPILKYEVEIDAPEKLPLKSIALKDKAGTGVKFKEEKKNGRIYYHWKAENVPQAIPEPDMPPLYTSVQRLLVGTAKNWKEISQWYYKLCRPHLDKTDAAIRQKTAELTKNAKSREEKITALFQFVSQQIRYMGLTPESEAPGYEPHDVTMTFHRRYGVCRDKAALLAAMLEAAGLKAYPVLIMAGIPKDDDVPNGYFNHAITAVETSQGEYILMDPTNESARELLPATLANCSYLVAKPEGDKLRRTPSPDSKYNQLAISSASELHGDGRLSGTITLKFTGINDMLYRDALSRWTPEEAEQYFSRRLNAAIPGAELLKLEVFPVPVRDMSKALEVKLHYAAENMLPERNGPAVLQLPELGDAIGASGFLLGSFALEKRRFKLQLSSTFSVKERYTLKLPAHLKLISLPRAEKLAEKKLMHWERKITQNKNIISGERSFSVDSLEFTPEDYLKSRALLQKMDMKKRALPIAENDFAQVRDADMNKVFAGADTLILADKTKWTLKDNNRWEEETFRRIKILTYAGMKDGSEIKIHYNPIRESVKISGRVILPDGRERLLKESEKNIMDAPWNAAAPRYPGEKILVANLPGVEINSVIEFKIIRNVIRPFFAQEMTFANYDPAVKKERIIDVPERIHLHYSPLPPGVAFTQEHSGNRRIYTWTAQNIRKVHSERNQPLFRNFVPTVLVSSGNWKSIALEISRKLEKASSPELNQNTKNLAAKLLADLPEKGTAQERLLNKIVRLRDFVSKNIRPAGPGLSDLPLKYLTEADVTLASGYGHSADRAILLGALLKSSGIAPEYVPVSDLLSTPKMIRGFERFPQMIFNDVLVYVPEAGIYLNDTSHYAEPGTLNSANRIALSLKNSRLEALHPILKHESRTERLVEIRISHDDSADITISDKYFGSYFESANRRCTELTPELKKRHFAELAAQISRAAVIKGTPVTDFTSYPGRVSYTLHCPGFAASSGAYKEFDLPFFKMFSLAAGAVKKHRKTPYQRRQSFGLSIRYTVSYPARYAVSSERPARLRLGNHAIGTFSQNCTTGTGKLDMTCKIKIPAGIIPAADCDSVFTFNQQLARPNAGKIVLIPRGEKKK